MIENYNETKNPIEGEIVDYKKYIGVGSVNVLAVNPNNATLRKFGWNIPDDADEQKYIYEKLKDGKTSKSTKIRVLVQITDLEDKPIVPLDFWIGPEALTSADGKKGQVIDNFGRTAWGNIQEELRKGLIPQYANGPANIDSEYHACHRGEEALCRFVLRYMNVKPLQRYDRVLQEYVDNEKPGKFRFDNWNRLCAGDVSELIGYFKLRPDNHLKVIFGVSTNDNNRTYQTFLNTAYVSNGVMPDRNTGEYTSAKNAIAKYVERRGDTGETFSAAPVKLWLATATEEIKDNSGSMFDSSGNYIEDDLPL